MRGALARLDAAVLAAESLSAASSDPVVDLAEAVSVSEALKARAAGLVAVLEERRRGVDRALGATVDHDVIASLEAEAAGLRARLTEADEEAAALLPAADALASAEEALAGETAEVEAAWPAGGGRPVRRRAVGAGRAVAAGRPAGWRSGGCGG